MRKVKDIIGSKVITFDTGEKIDTVEDVLFEPGEDMILALLIDRGGWLSRAKIIPFDSIKTIGDDAVIIPSRSSVMLVGDDPRVKRALESHKAVSGMDVYTSDGKFLGTIADMVVNETTGRVEGYEISGGFMKESLRGRKFVPTPETMTVGRQVVFVPPETGYRVENEVTGGIQGAAETTRDRMQDAAERARMRAGEAAEGLKESAGDARERFSETADDMRGRVSEATTDQQRHYVVGKKASDTVTTSRGTVIVHRDQLITDQMAYEAEREGVLGQLAASAGGAHARETMGNLREEASGAYDQMKRTFEDWTRRAQDRTREERIKAALGRPVTRVIFDRNDQVILNTGEIITHQAIQRADAAGELDTLLSSVSKQEPEFGLQERKAPMAGEARIQPSTESSGAGEPMHYDEPRQTDTNVASAREQVRSSSAGTRHSHWTRSSKEYSHPIAPEQGGAMQPGPRSDGGSMQDVNSPRRI